MLGGVASGVDARVDRHLMGTIEFDLRVLHTCRQPLEEDVSRYGTHLYVSRAEWHLGRSLAYAAEV